MVNFFKINILFLVFFLGMKCTIANNFTILSLSKNSKKVMTDRGVWKEGCPITLERLRVIKFPYYDFNGIEHKNGEIVVLDVVADYVVNIFKELHSKKFPIYKASPIENYNGSDEKSMADNNSSCFNCREIVGGGLPSIHSYGLAIDINPIQNPYIVIHNINNKKQGLLKILPVAGYHYLNRTKLKPGMTEHIINVFAKNGFKIWGGNWDNPIDWQHFQPSRTIAQLLAAMTYSDGLIFFKSYLCGSKLLNSIDPQDNKLVDFYKKSPKIFMQYFKKNPNLLNMQPKQAYYILLKNKEFTNVSQYSNLRTAIKLRKIP